MIWQAIRLQRASTLLLELCEILDEDPTFMAPTAKLEKLHVLGRKAWNHLEHCENTKPREREMVRAEDMIA